MSSKDISRFVFINPSPILCEISKYIRKKGFDVEAVSVDFMGIESPKAVNFFAKKNINSLKKNETNLINFKAINKAFVFKKPFFDFGKTKGKINLENFLNVKSIGNIVDLQFLTSGSFFTFECEMSNCFESFQQVFSSFDNCVFISAWYPDSLNQFSSKKFHVNIYETDFDIKKVFGREYFIIFDDTQRIEIFYFENKLYLISEFNDDLSNVLFKIFKFLEKYDFSKVRSFDMVRNINTYMKISKDKKKILVNDYSYFNISACMPVKWIEVAGDFICSGKLL